MKKKNNQTRNKERILSIRGLYCLGLKQNSKFHATGEGVCQRMKKMLYMHILKLR